MENRMVLIGHRLGVAEPDRQVAETISSSSNDHLNQHKQPLQLN